MLNRPRRRVFIDPAALEARLAVATAFRSHSQQPPTIVCDWHLIGLAFHPQLSTPQARDEIAKLASALSDTVARGEEIGLLWLESLATAAFAMPLAKLLGVNGADCAVAGLLHRVGDLLTLRALGQAEEQVVARLDGGSKAELLAHHGGPLMSAAMRAWDVPAAAAAAAIQWRQVGDLKLPGKSATVVYLAQLVALDALHPQLFVPGFLAAAAQECGVSAESLSVVRSEGLLRHGLDSLQSAQ
jgi:hypothetical protein